MFDIASQKRKRSAKFAKGDKVLLCDLVKQHDKGGLISGLAAKSRSAGVVLNRNAIWDLFISDFNAATISD